MPDARNALTFPTSMEGCGVFAVNHHQPGRGVTPEYVRGCRVVSLSMAIGSESRS
jgi:hypothetical protein